TARANRASSSRIAASEKTVRARRSIAASALRSASARFPKRTRTTQHNAREGAGDQFPERREGSRVPRPSALAPLLHSELDDLRAHLGEAGSDHGQLLRRGAREVDHTALPVGTAIVDPHVDALTRVLANDADDRPERERTMRRG